MEHDDHFYWLCAILVCYLDYSEREESIFIKELDYPCGKTTVYQAKKCFLEADTPVQL